MKNRKQQSGFTKAIKKFFLSAFVVVSFAAYALENRGAANPNQPGATGSQGNLSPQTAAPTISPSSVASEGLPAQPAPTQSAPTQSAAPTQAFAPTNPPTAAPTTAPTVAAQNGQFKNGTYTGPTVDVIYGYVQVQAVVQNGKITNVQFLQYPQDRRTSQYINSFAVPVLQQEALQAQSANVNLISGATLTSEGFVQSLQTALSQAGG